MRGRRKGGGRDPEPVAPTLPSGPLELETAVDLLLEEVVVEPEVLPLLSPRSIRGRCVIVSGAATGIGRATALEFARNGAHVAFTFFDYDGDGYSAADAERTAREITQLEVRVHAEECDVRDASAVDGFVARAIEKLGGLHVLVNNSGITRDRALWRLTDEQWRLVLETNLTGAFNLTRAVTPYFRSQGEGKIVNVASVHGLRSEFGIANYSASTAGLISLTRSAAIELGPSNVNVNAVAPGQIRSTGRGSRFPAEVADRPSERSALGRTGEPEDVAHVVLFLCSEMARHITGAVIPVDGGELL